MWLKPLVFFSPFPSAEADGKENHGAARRNVCSSDWVVEFPGAAHRNIIYLLLAHS